MPPLSSIHKPTPSLVVAPTQNTAPVHEYRCLYTRDLHKKAKKWHDGALRFHTFNQRVMVYDDSKNYIGDLHYRDQEPFGEGVEIQLDRGVKVEVGELSGQTETDLTPLLNRPQPEKSAQPSKQRPSQASQRPKSLLEVLGPSQRRLARSRLPLQSPYEQRQSLNPSESTGHPSKRPRLSSDKENHPRNVPCIITTNKPPVPSLSARPELSALKRPSIHVPRYPASSSISFEEVVDIASDDEARCQRRKPTMSSTRQEASKMVPKHAPPAERTVKAKEQGRGTVEENATKAARPNLEGRRLEKPRKPEPSVSSLSRTSEPSSARLLLSQLKPRPKLVYVLSQRPSSRLTDGASAVSPMTTRPCNGNSHSPIRIDSSSPDTQLSVATTPSPHQVGLVSQNSPVDRISPRSPLAMHSHANAQSPLFVPEEQSNIRSPSPLLFTTPNKLASPDLGQTQHSARSKDSPLRASITGSSPRDRNKAHHHIVAGFEMSPSQHEQEEMNATLQQPGPVPFQVSLTPKRTFRRVLSENSAIQGRNLCQDLDNGIILRSPLEVLENLASRRSLSKHKSPSKLNRCASDTAALETNVVGLLAQQPETCPKGTSGPWTSEESFLLFDWWPSELEKPGLWKAALEISEPVESRPLHPELSTRITTARQFFLNDVR